VEGDDGSVERGVDGLEEDSRLVVCMRR
jgi:hypothetical protein